MSWIVWLGLLCLLGCHAKRPVVRIKEIPADAVRQNTRRPQSKPIHLMVDGVDEDLTDFISPTIRENGSFEAEIMKADEEVLKALAASQGNRKRRAVPSYIRFGLDKPQSISKIRRKRFFGTWMLWPQEKVPYEWGNVTLEEKDTALAAMKIVEELTCVRFLEHDGMADFNSKQGLPHSDRLVFIKEDNRGCWSHIGRRRDLGKQYLSACDDLMTALHEVAHALGAYHEHVSFDAPGNIQMKLENVDQSNVGNFAPIDINYKKYFHIGDYDLQSIMHYDLYDFSVNGLPTLVPLYKDFAKPGADYWLLMKEINQVYGCYEKRCPSQPVECANEGYPAYQFDTCGCVCPEGLDSYTNCTQLYDTGCGGIINLDKDHRSKEISLPEVVAENTICTWVVKSTGRVMLNVDKFKLAGTYESCTASLGIRRNLLCQLPAEYCGDGFEKSIFSTGNYMAIDVKVNSDTKAVFSATVHGLFADESCYNLTDRGETYNGDLNRSEDYHQCLNWVDTTSCNYCPFDFDGELKADYSGNSCRNPGGLLHRPWCYTGVTPTGCTLRYCEPCQKGRTYDFYDHCDQILRRLPNFCNYEEAKQGCRKTCGIADTEILGHKCGPPPAVVDAEPLTNTQSVYDIGDEVSYKCAANPAATSSRWCLSTGRWSDLATACNGCADKKSDCVDMLKTNQSLCVEGYTYARISCSKTCGVCGDNLKVCDVKTPDIKSNTVLLTTQSIVTQGQTIKYACVDGFLYQSGDLTHVCLPDGSVYGEMPKCSKSNFVPTPVSSLQVTQFQFNFYAHWAVIGSNQYTRIEKAGALQTWYYYCAKAGVVVLAVFRDTPEGVLVVGSTVLECEGGHMNTHRLNPLTSIHVEVGDYIGSLDAMGNCLTYSLCSDGSTTSYLLFVYNPSNIVKDAIVPMPARQMCLFASINADIGPIEVPSGYQLIEFYLTTKAPAEAVLG